MPHYFAALTLILLIGMVLARVLLMKRQGIKAIKFGNIDKKDFLIPPFVLFYFYIICAEAFPLPAVSHQEFFESYFSPWIGVAFCTVGLGLLFWSLISFGQSFRVGIDSLTGPTGLLHLAYSPLAAIRFMSLSPPCY